MLQFTLKHCTSQQQPTRHIRTRERENPLEQVEMPTPSPHTFVNQALRDRVHQHVVRLPTLGSGEIRVRIQALLTPMPGCFPHTSSPASVSFIGTMTCPPTPRAFSRTATVFPNRVLPLLHQGLQSVSPPLAPGDSGESNNGGQQKCSCVTSEALS